jgi:hypothetical protein
MRSLRSLLTASLLLVALTPLAARVKVSITTDALPMLTLENDHIRMRYGSDDYARGAMLELTDKKTGYDAVNVTSGPRQSLDNSTNSAPLNRIRVLWQSDTETAVELLWGTGETATDKWDPHNKRQIIVMRADSPVLKLIYVSKWHMFEWGAERVTGQGKYYIYGAKEWMAKLGHQPVYFHHKEPGFDGTGAFYKFERDGLDVPINYHGHAIMGIHNPAGHGYVRVMPLEKVPHLKMMGPPECGYESYRNARGLVCYIAPVTGGEAGIERLGKAIVDTEGRLR